MYKRQGHDYAATAHTHDYSGTYSALAHTHDDRYYTEAEIGVLLASYSTTAHNHTGVYATAAHNHDSAYSAASHTHALDGLSDVDTTGAATGKVLTYDSGSWVAATPASGVTDHGLLSGLSDDDHAQYYNQTRGDARYSLATHNHDSAYAASGHAHDYSATYAALSHAHGDLYYTEAVSYTHLTLPTIYSV